MPMLPSPRVRRWLAASGAAALVHLVWMAGPPAAAPAAPPTRVSLQVRSVAAAAPRTATPPRAGAPRQRARPAPASTAPAPPTPSFVPPPPITLDYRWLHGDTPLPARLVWAPRGTQYTLSLETVGTEGRAVAWLRSEGAWDADGLRPARHTARRPRTSERALTFVRDAAVTEVAFSTQTTRASVPMGTQDGISWLPHWLGLLQAHGASWPIAVADTDGTVRQLHLVSNAPGALHWLGVPGGPHDDRVEVWLSALPPHWPMRLRIVNAWGGVNEWIQAMPDDGAPITTDPPP